MPSIRININSRAMPNQKSTTFTENLARFFLTAWQFIDSDNTAEPKDWLATKENPKSYVSRTTAAKHFQVAINEMIAHYDNIYGLNVKDAERWCRDEVEYHLLYIIAHAGRLGRLPAIPSRKPRK